MPDLIERKAYEFTILSSDMGGEQEFLALQNRGRSEFVLYWLNGEEGDYEYICAPDSEEKLIPAAIDYLVEQWHYTRENLSAKGVAS